MRESRPFQRAVFPVVFLALWLAAASVRTAAQAVPSAHQGGVTLTFGGTASGYTLQYGKQRLLGASAFVVGETRHRIGFEGEARWLLFFQTNQEHATTYLAGPRFAKDFGRYQPYVKGLVGFGQFNFPYNLGTDNCLVIAPGGGIDIRVNHRIQIRAADFEYQIWPQFHYGSMSSYGVSSGIRVRIF